nr:retrovirus-related Pol polyprotein from transposon TNT 1-94 [Tanacetum cinerariifolium]
MQINIPKSSETEDSTLPNQDTDEVPSYESQRNINDPLVVVSNSSTNDYDSANESLVCNTPLLSLKKLDGVEPVSGPKTIKLIMKLKSTFKDETLKKSSSAPTRGKRSSASKTNLVHVGKLKNVKIEDDPPLAIVMKELNELKLQISKKTSSDSKNKNAQQVPPNALQNRYKNQFKMNCDLCGENNHLYENLYIHNHKDHLGKFDEKADDGYLLGYTLVSKAFRVFNTRRQQTKKTYHVTFGESPDAIKFLKHSVDDINIAETKSYPPDEYLHPYEPSQRYQTNSNDVSFIEPYEIPELVVLESEVSSNQNGKLIKMIKMIKMINLLKLIKS